MHTANFLRNVSPTTRNGSKTPHEKFWNLKPDLLKLRVFGCEAFAQVPKEEREEKLDKRSIHGVMMGYEPDTKGYRILNLDDLSEILVSRNVKFNEDVMPFKEIEATDEPQSIYPGNH